MRARIGFLALTNRKQGIKKMNKTKNMIVLMMATAGVGIVFADTQTVNGVEWRYTIDGGSVTINSGARDEWGAETVARLRTKLGID